MAVVCRIGRDARFCVSTTGVKPGQQHGQRTVWLPPQQAVDGLQFGGCRGGWRRAMACLYSVKVAFRRAGDH